MMTNSIYSLTRAQALSHVLLANAWWFVMARQSTVFAGMAMRISRWRKGKWQTSRDSFTAVCQQTYRYAVDKDAGFGIGVEAGRIPLARLSVMDCTSWSRKSSTHSQHYLQR